MVSKVLLALCVVVVVAAAVPAGPGAGWGGMGAAGWGGVGGWGMGGGANPWIPPWIASAPWMPQWAPCSAIGSDCLDCNTKVVCTKVGGIQKACSDPTLPYCNAGECSATPSDQCAVPIVPLAAGTA